MKLLLGTLAVFLLLTLSTHIDAQRTLSKSEMMSLFKYQSYDYPGVNKVHTCAYLRLSANAYTSNKQHDAHLECNCVRKIYNCRSQAMSVVRKCCPGFKEFTDGSTTMCLERVLPRYTFQQTLINMQATALSTALFDQAYGAYFNDSQATYTLFVVRDADGVSTSSFTRKQTSVTNYATSTFVHVAKGRVYTQAMSQENSITTMHKSGAKNTEIKFSRYSNGIMCVECSVVKEANYEAANGVIHVVDSPFMGSASSRTLAATLRAEYAYFWNALSATMKAQLEGTVCGSWFTVFVPSQATWGNANSITAANHVIKGLWCSSGLVSQNSANLATMAGDVLQLGCSGDARQRIMVSSNGRSGIIDSSERGRTFDRMATNGVIHVINAKLEPRVGQSFRFAVQLDEVEAGEPRDSLFYEFNSCGIEFDANKKYIVLVPTQQAMTKFYKYRSTKKDAQLYLRSQDMRCNLLRYHILETEDGLTDLDRVMHLQKSYKTMLGNNIKVNDFLIASGQKMTPYFMYAKSSGGQSFVNGHIYKIDRVLLPPTAERWLSIVNTGRGLSESLKSTLNSRMRNLAVMEAATPSSQQCTHFVPPEADLEQELLVKHSAKYSLWSNYLRNGDSLELPSCTSGGTNLLLRRVSRRLFTISFMGSNLQVKVQAANILRSSGMLWFIERALQ